MFAYGKNNAKLFYALLGFIFKFLVVIVSYLTGEPQFYFLHNLCDTIIHFHEHVSYLNIFNNELLDLIMGFRK